MEILPILLLIVLVILVINLNSNVKSQISRLEGEIRLLRHQLSKFISDSATKESFDDEKIKAVEEKKYWESGFKEEKEIVPVKTQPEVVKQPIEEKPVEKIPLVEPVPLTTVEIEETISAPIKKQTPPPQPTPSFFERHPDMEKFIGENLISKIGIAILVLAIGYFVKYAIDQNWIGPVGRVAIGILCGGILVGLAHRLRNVYKGFSSVLAGGGLAIFYFTIFLAYEEFDLFSQPVAFIIMAVITIFAVILALLYDKQELAIIALIGGFAAPFLVDNGNDNYVGLFSYLIILNAGLLVIAYNKAWRILNILSFLFTIILFGGWILTLDSTKPNIYRNGFLFASIFYLMYFFINIAHNVKEKKKFIASDFGILLLNTCLYFSAGIYFLNEMNLTEFKGLFSASLGIFNLAASWILFRKQKVDSNILYLLVGITLTFVSITAPIQLHGNNVTIFWASEAVLLYWLFTKSRIVIVQYASILIWVAMLVSLLMDWTQVYALYSDHLAIVFNKGFITTVYCSIATYAIFILVNKQPKTENSTDFFIPAKNAFRIFAILILFAAGALETNYQFRHFYPETDFYILYLLLYSLIFVNVILLITQNIKQLVLPQQISTGMLAICIVYYLICIPTFFDIQRQILLYGKKNAIHFMAHWGAAILIIWSSFKLLSLLRNSQTQMKKSFEYISWALCIFAVVYLGVELQLLSNTIFYSANTSLDEIARVYIKTVLPILWGLCSFTFIWLGMKYKYRPLRIVSLTLFTITLLKLFIFDIRNIPAGGKIAAFFCLGVLLLVVSFMYQRLKKIIIDDEVSK